ncbi:MAG: winged helix-turn-helix domain-containing protein [Elusimicrobiales bacterium]|nr:winged helix-turn-helix domain-containing protein [Elusimicrobiales bacterium]
MDEASKFGESIVNNSNKILQILKSGEEMSSWDIKLKLHLSSSELYLAIGRLFANNDIQLYQKDLTYIVRLSSKT